MEQQLCPRVDGERGALIARGRREDPVQCGALRLGVSALAAWAVAAAARRGAGKRTPCRKGAAAHLGETARAPAPVAEAQRARCCVDVIR